MDIKLKQNEVLTVVTGAGGSVVVPDNDTNETKVLATTDQIPVVSSDRIVSPNGGTVVSAVDGGTATISSTSIGNPRVTFPEGFSVTVESKTYTAPSGGETIEFIGPYQIEPLPDVFVTLWIPSSYADDPQSFSPYEDGGQWFMECYPDTTSPLYLGFYLIDEGSVYLVSNFNSLNPTLTLDTDVSHPGQYVVGGPATITRESIGVKTLATVDQIADYSNDIGERLDDIEGRIEDLSNDIVDLRQKDEELKGAIDDLSNDIHSMQSDRIVSENSKVVVKAENNGTATITNGELAPPVINGSLSISFSGTQYPDGDGDPVNGTWSTSLSGPLVLKGPFAFSSEDSSGIGSRLYYVPAGSPDPVHEPCVYGVPDYDYFIRVDDLSLSRDAVFYVRGRDASLGSSYDISFHKALKNFDTVEPTWYYSDALSWHLSASDEVRAQSCSITFSRSLLARTLVTDDQIELKTRYLFTDWVIKDDAGHPSYVLIYWHPAELGNQGFWEFYDYEAGKIPTDNHDRNAVRVEHFIQDFGYSVIATRSLVSGGYILGSQTQKPLASEEEIAGLSSDIVDLRQKDEELEGVIDDLSNDIHSMQSDRIVSENGVTTIKAENDRKATISVSELGNPVVTFYDGFGVKNTLNGEWVFTVDGADLSIEFVECEHDGRTYYLPSDVDPSSYDWSRMPGWYILVSGNSGVLSYGSTSYEDMIGQINTSSPTISHYHGPYRGTLPTISREAPFVKTIATVDQVDSLINGLSDDVYSAIEDLSNDLHSEMDALSNSVDSRLDDFSNDFVRSVNGQHGAVHLDATNLYMDSNDQVTIADAISHSVGSVVSVNEIGPDPATGNVWLYASDIGMGYESNDISISEAISGKQDALTFDSEPTRDSTNPVTSGGVYNALDTIYIHGISAEDGMASISFDSNDVPVFTKVAGLGTTEVVFKDGYSVSYNGISYSASGADDVRKFSASSIILPIELYVYVFWLQEGASIGPDFNPFDGDESNDYGVDWYFWNTYNPGDDLSNAAPAYFSYKNGPSYDVSGWNTETPALVLRTGTSSGADPEIRRYPGTIVFPVMTGATSSTAVPMMDSGSGEPGDSLNYSRSNHVHPSDTSRVAQGSYNKMVILDDGSVSIVPYIYTYSSNNGISSSGETIATAIPSGSEYGGIYIKLSADAEIGSSLSEISSDILIYYNDPIVGSTSPVEPHRLYYGRINLNRVSTGNYSISLVESIEFGQDANGTDFSLTQAFSYLNAGNASLQYPLSASDPFVIDIGSLVWTSGGQNPNTTIDIPLTKTLATTKYVDDAVAGGGGGGVSSVNGQHGPVVVLDGTDILVDESNDVRTLAEAISDIPASSVMYDESNSETVADALSRLDADMGDIASVLDAINGESL